MELTFFLRGRFNWRVNSDWDRLCESKQPHKNDSAIGIVFTAFFSIGIILITFLKSSSDLYHILFGNVLAVRSSDMWITLGIGIFILLAVIVFYKELLISSFDPVISSVYGLPNRMIHYFLMTLLTLVTVASLQTVGIILVVAMLITPAATAYLLTDRLWIMIYLSAFFGAVSAVVGLGLSFTYNLSSGASIVLVATILFGSAFIFSPKQGILWRSLKSKRKRTHLKKEASM
ncbi:hypothetical protein BsIDN1_59050 [Bacillus safensis]|uniref:Manganese transport system membrane protein MntB n=1 Tax=Bacillus safensis TaxID=561879 RepID=A0A5S9MFM6_BACIA|nr:hypothetical protein BsIDN1_59050 [Bacillus safensis]